MLEERTWFSGVLRKDRRGGLTRLLSPPFCNSRAALRSRRSAKQPVPDYLKHPTKGTAIGADCRVALAFVLQKVFEIFGNLGICAGHSSFAESADVNSYPAFCSPFPTLRGMIDANNRSFSRKCNSPKTKFSPNSSGFGSFRFAPASHSSKLTLPGSRSGRT